MRVAIIGTRGYPYVYGGYETFVKELAERLVKRGVEVHVYNQRHLFKEKPTEVNGIRLHYVPTFQNKVLNQLVHSFLSLVHATFSKADVILVLNLAAGPMGFIPRLFGKKTMINTDGMEWLRPKWRGMGAKYFYFGAWCAGKFYDKIITDADAMQEVYRKEFKTDSTVIAYGAPEYREADPGLISRFGLAKEDYYLVVGRLIPDNNADLIIRAFLSSGSGKKLLVVGDVPYEDEYAQSLKALASENLIFPGYVRDQNELMALYQNCFVYFHGHEFGGTNPAMLKAMSNKCAILALNTSFNREMLQDGEFGIFFERNIISVTEKISMIEENPVQLTTLRNKVQLGLGVKYNWDAITAAYMFEFDQLSGQGR